MPEKPASRKKDKPKSRAIGMQIFRIVRVPLLSVLAILAGLWIGYSKLGGQPASEIFHFSTWKHLYDLVFAD